MDSLAYIRYLVYNIGIPSNDDVSGVPAVGVPAVKPTGDYFFKDISDLTIRNEFVILNTLEESDQGVVQTPLILNPLELDKYFNTPVPTTDSPIIQEDYAGTKTNCLEAIGKVSDFNTYRYSGRSMRSIIDEQLELYNTCFRHRISSFMTRAGSTKFTWSSSQVVKIYDSNGDLTDTYTVENNGVENEFSDIDDPYSLIEVSFDGTDYYKSLTVEKTVSVSAAFDIAYVKVKWLELMRVFQTESVRGPDIESVDTYNNSYYDYNFNGTSSSGTVTLLPPDLPVPTYLATGFYTTGLNSDIGTERLYTLTWEEIKTLLPKPASWS